MSGPGGFFRVESKESAGWLVVCRCVSLSLSSLCLAVVVVVVVVVVCVRGVVCCGVWGDTLKNPVCAFQTSPCVPATSPHV